MFLLCGEKGKHQGQCYLMSQDHSLCTACPVQKTEKVLTLQPSQEWSEHSRRTISESQRGRNEELCYQQKLSVERECAGILHYEKRINSPPTLSPWYIKYKKPTEISQGTKLYQKLLNNSSEFYFYIGRRRGRRLGERKIPRSFPQLLYFTTQDYLQTIM